ncbi:MAG: extracellular solute-binding protein [Deltaproteobacteria bacterium]|nr:extracellular solute-binding protein [Deltaproteobacteria bacterium]
MRRSAALLALALALWTAPVCAQPVVLWHAWRGEEQRALDTLLARWRRTHPELQVDALAIPYDAFAARLEAAIPHGHGPDVFIDSHERLWSYRELRLLAPWTGVTPPSAFDATASRALTLDGLRYGIPLSVKCVALYYNPVLLPTPPHSLEELEALRGRLPRGVFPLVYEVGSAYLHAPLAHAYGSGLLDEQGRYAFVGPGAERSVEHALRLVREGVVPEEAGGSLVAQLFSEGRAAAAISGPWLAAELGDRVRYRVAPLPVVDGAGGRRMEPYATVEGAYLSSRARNPEGARALVELLVSVEGARERALAGREVVATSAAWSDPELARDERLAVFREAALTARPMPVRPTMRAAWEPAHRALLKVLRGDLPPEAALREGARRFADVTRPLPPRKDATGLLLALGALALVLAFEALRRGRAPEARRALRRSLPAYRWVAHAALAVGLLVLLPLLLGALTSLCATREGAFYYVGLANYRDILTARGGALLASGSFYRVLAVTVLWTAANLALHVSLGLALALALHRPSLKLRALYRVLLIVPWAVPSYVTALAWKGMFHRQFGAMNALLKAVGAEPLAWFSRFSTAFAANLATNVWLGFPFMMVVSLGALAAIPKDLYEAAEVDGATAWQRFRHVTVPLLVPTLGPSVALGAVWTFNQFNVVFLVSGGEPDGETDILVSEAYRWAFTRQAQYGYAAAYAVLIFGLLLVTTGRRRP